MIMIQICNESNAYQYFVRLTVTGEGKRNLGYNNNY